MSVQPSASAAQPAISVDGVTKVYRTYEKPWHKLAEMVSGDRRRYGRETLALDRVSFELAKGDRLGIVGVNGSGKSTLLKLICGVVFPTKGQIRVNGRVSAMLELGAGFNPDLTGYANMEHFAMLRGFDPDEVARAMPDIAAFSELGDFLYQPVRTYSSGMSMRLGFACAAYTKPEILIIDEALSVGDAYFQNKCLHKIRSMLDDGVTFIYVTHAPDSVRALCNRGLWLEAGAVRQFGSAYEVGASYQSAMVARMVRAGMDPAAEIEADTHKTKRATAVDQARRRAFRDRVAQLRTGSGEIRITDLALVNKDGALSDHIDIDENLTLQTFFTINAPPPADCDIAVGITDAHGREIVHFSSGFKDINLSKLERGVEHCLQFRFKNPLCPGEFGLIAGVGPLIPHPQRSGFCVPTEIVDYVVGGSRFTVSLPVVGQGKDMWGIVHTSYSAALVQDELVGAE